MRVTYGAGKVSFYGYACASCYLHNSPLMKTFLRSLLPYLGAIAFLLLIGHLREAHAQEMAVRTIVPQAASHHATIAVHGDVVAWEVMPVAAEMAGQRIVQLLADVGDTVKKGQVLAVLDDSFVKLEIERIKAQAEQAALALQQARGDAERARSLQASGALPQQQIEALLTQEQSAAQQVQSLQAQLRSQQLRLERSRITAPDAGVVMSKETALGQVAGAGQVLFRLLRQGRLEWHARVQALDAARLAVGMPVRLHAGGKSHAGKVRAIAPDMNSRTREATVVVALEAGLQDGLLPGMFAQGEFVLQEAKGWRVPHAAVVLRDGQALVFKVDETSHARAVPVEIVEQTAEYMLVAGVGESDSIVARGGEFLADGEAVTMLPE